MLVKMGTLGFISVTIPSKHQLKVDGFCGNYDGNADNDVLLKDGSDVTLGLSDKSQAGQVLADIYTEVDEEDP